MPLAWGYALLRHFHRPSQAMMVPTSGVLQMLRQRGFQHLKEWTHGVDMRLFALAETPKAYPPLGALARPISLFVGRMSHEKNIDAFFGSGCTGKQGGLWSRAAGGHAARAIPRCSVASTVKHN